MNMTVRAFYDRYHTTNRDWALAQNVQTMDELWKLPIPYDWRQWIATRPGVLTDRELRLLACWCVRQIWPLLTDDETARRSVEVAEAYANGHATSDELNTAHYKALDWGRVNTARFGAYHEGTAAMFASFHDAQAAAVSASLHSTIATTTRAAYDLGCGCSVATFFARESRWLLDNTKPNFNLEV